MTDLPRRPLPPLDPPAGAFDEVARRARGRRTRTASLASGGALAVALAGVVGVSALSGPTAAPDELRFASPSASAATSPPAAPAPEATPTSSEPPRPSPAERAPTAGPVPSGCCDYGSEPGSDQAYRGRLVDPSGRPVGGMRVYAFQDRRDGFSGMQVHVTRPDGTFQAPCDGRAVLVSSTQLYRPDRGDLTRNWAMRFVDDDAAALQDAKGLPCTDEVRTTRLSPGAVLEGDLWRESPSGSGRYERYADGQGPGFGLACPFADDYICSGWVSENGRYRFVGLPAGTVRLGGMYDSVSVQVRAGSTTTRDWWECLDCRDARPRPEPTASPAPTASAGAGEPAAG